MNGHDARNLETRVAQRLFAPLAGLRQRVRLYMLADGLLWLTLAVLAAALLQLILDRLMKLSLDQRVAVNIALTLFWLAILYRRVLRPLLRPIPDVTLARAVDRAHPEFHDGFTAAVEFARATPRVAIQADGQGVGPVQPGHRCGAGEHTRVSPVLIRDVLERACRDAERISFPSLLNHRRAASATFVIFALVLGAALSFQVMPDLLGTWFARNWLLEDMAWPQKTYIRPEGFGADGRRRLARGDPVELTAAITGLTPDEAVLHWRTRSGQRGRESMSVRGEPPEARLVVALGPLTENVYFRISGGDERTREFVIEAVERPCVLHTRARIRPPAYTGLAAVELEQQTVLEVLQDSLLEIEARLNKPVQAARLIGADSAAAPADVEWSDAADAAGPLVRVHWPAPQSGVYHLELRDFDGLESRSPLRYTLKVVPDRPPQVALLLAAVGELVTPQAELISQVDLEDAYGLAAGRVLVQAGLQAEWRFDLPGVTRALRKHTARLPLALAALAATPGDELRIWAEAEDIDPRGPNVGAAPAANLRVVSSDEFLAEMARRELVLRQEFERVLSEQRRLNDALERLLAASGEASAKTAAGPGGFNAVAAQRLGALARTQSGQAGRCTGIARGFDQILAEMQTSRVARPADERRIAQLVVEPLVTLARQPIPAAADRLAELRRGGDAELCRAAAAAQAELLRDMEQILANMLEWEGYREAVALLESAIAAQHELRSDTLAALESQLERILAPDAPENSDPGWAGEEQPK